MSFHVGSATINYNVYVWQIVDLENHNDLSIFILSCPFYRNSSHQDPALDTEMLINPTFSFFRLLGKQGIYLPYIFKMQK